MYTIHGAHIDVKCSLCGEFLMDNQTDTPTSSKVQMVRVERDQAGQRLDNFLLRRMKGLPRSRVYRLVRRGEVRVNKKRCKPEYKLEHGDNVRIPPFNGAESGAVPLMVSDGLANMLREAILHEDEQMLVLNKPAGLAVHRGSGIRLGIIEAIRQVQPDWAKAELVHRLDRDTSGVLLIAKDLKSLRTLQDQFRSQQVNKTYLALVCGSWPAEIRKIDAPLLKSEAVGGDRVVTVNPEGKAATTYFNVLERFQGATLLEVKPETGRTHQIRVHCQHAGHGVVGDPKYDSPNSVGPGISAKYLCLHAKTLSFRLPGSGQPVEISASLDSQFDSVLRSLRKTI